MFFIDSLPERYKQEVIRTFPHLIGEQKKPDIMEKITIDLRAIAYYSDFALPDGRHLTADKQSVLSNNASILRSLSTTLRDSDAMAGRLGSSKIKRGDFWQRMADAIADGSISLPNTLPKNARSLSRLHQRFEAEGYGALISKKYGNSDAAKVATEAQRSALMQLISNPNNLNDEQICQAYNHFRTESGATMARDYPADSGQLESEIQLRDLGRKIGRQGDASEGGQRQGQAGGAILQLPEHHLLPTLGQLERFRRNHQPSPTAQRREPEYEA